MKYTTTANFAMAGAMGGIKTGVLNRITGQLGSTVDKAKSWLQKAKQTKEKVGSATIAKQRLKPQPYVSPNLKAEEIARRKYGQPAVVTPVVNQGALERGQTMKSNLGGMAKERVEQQARGTTQASQALRANTRNNNYQYARNAQSQGVLANAGSGSRTDALANQQSLRLRYTKDPRTGKLVGAAYSKLSLLCDL